MDSCAINGIQRAMRWLLERGSKGNEVSSSFLDNGRNLLEGLASASNCKYDIPFRNFKAKEIICATSNFKETVMFDGTGDMFHGCFQHRSILVKRYRIFGDFQRFLPFISRDIVISLMMSRHKNVMRFLGCCLDFKAPVLVYEYTGKDRLLHDILHSRKRPTSWKYNESLPWKIRLKIGTDVANAIVYLHTAFSTPVIHRDLSTKNVVIDQFGAAKLIDFSFCISLPPGESQVEDIVVGTTRYSEPEYAMTGIVTEKTDVFRFGVLLLELFTGKRVFDLLDECCGLVACVPDHIENNHFNKILDLINVVASGETSEEQLQHLAELIFRCTRYKGENRPNMIDVARELRTIERSGRLR